MTYMRMAERKVLKMKKDNGGVAVGWNSSREVGGEGDALLTVPQAAAYLGWASGTVYHKLHQLPGVVHLSRRCVRIWKSELVAWAKQRTRNNDEER
jgi:predicted DNA-binding transcriptional regulator AlpA